MTDSSANRTPKKAALIITQPDKRKTHKESAESDSAFRKMAAKSRQQIYDLANPEKQLLKQFSSAGMAKEAYANLMHPWEAINQNAVNALSVNPMVAHVNSVLEETINQNVANALCLNTAAAHADSVFQEAINQAATISTLNINAATDAHKALDAYNTSQCVDSLAAERLSKQISAVAGVDFDSAKALAEKIGTIPNLKELSAMVGLDSATALAEKINPKAFDAAALGMATLPQPESFLSIVNSKEEREAAKNEELNRKLRESSKQMWEMQEQQERRQKEIAKQAYLEALREHEAEKQAKEAQLQAETVADDGDKPAQEKRLILKERNTTELLGLIYQMFDSYKIRPGDKSDKLTAKAAWGLIIAKKYENDLIKTIAGERKTAHLFLNGGDEVDYETFSRTYNRRFR